MALAVYYSAGIASCSVLQVLRKGFENVLSVQIMFNKFLYSYTFEVFEHKLCSKFEAQ
jgi:hypothetical protein